MQVFAEIDPEVKRQRTLMFSLLFLLIGAVAFVTYFFQVCILYLRHFCHRIHFSMANVINLSLSLPFSFSLSPSLSLSQGFMFGKSGELLTMRLRSQTFKAMLRQVSSAVCDPKYAFQCLHTQGCSGKKRGG